MTDDREIFLRYLHSERSALLWKLDGLSERELRLPRTVTGTNLLGLLKHSASMEYGYFGEVFARPAPEAMPWLHPDAPANADMYAAAEESAADVIAFAERAWAHADETIRALRIDAPGRVPWWSTDEQNVTLGQILIHVLAEVSRHVGHADILREQIDGAAGLNQKHSNLPGGDAAWWENYVAQLRAIADAAGDTPA